MSADYTARGRARATVAFGKGDFVGREALLEREPRIRPRRLVM
jgi:hypothetical protein